MNKVDIYPAIDLMDGEVVRLKQGDPQRKTHYSSDPLEIAKRWQQSGARWLHVVNLDGALDKADARNLAALARIANALDGSVSIQFGGGLRSLAGLQTIFDAGVDRAVLGTAAVEEPEILQAALAGYGAARIAVGIDARSGVVRTRGWTRDAGLTVDAFGANLHAAGVRTVIFTDIARDSMGTGVDWQGAEALAGSGFEVIASGGAASLADVLNVRRRNLAGIIIGKALYDGRIDLAEALRAAEED